MSDADWILVAPHLIEQPMPLRMDLERPDRPIKAAFFISHGIASVVAISDRDTNIEVGLIGCEGVSGLAVIMGSDSSPHHTYMQVGGEGLAIPASALLRAIDQSATLQRLLLRYAQAFSIQTAHTAVANSKGNVEARLARWLLMAHDRVPANAIPLTHEFLSLMLGVRRAGVTDCVHALTKHGLISSPKPGLIFLVDRPGLEEIAGRYYGVPEREYHRLIA